MPEVIQVLFYGLSLCLGNTEKGGKGLGGRIEKIYLGDAESGEVFKVLRTGALLKFSDGVLQIIL